MRLLWILPLLLAGCDIKDKTPLPGSRESFLDMTASIAVDKNAIKSVPPTAAVPAGQLKAIHKINMGVGASTTQRILSNPIIIGDRVYTYDAAGVVHAFIRSTEEGQEGFQERWTVATTERTDDVLGGGIAVDNGRVYAITCFGDVFAIDDKGDILWKKSQLSPFRSQPFVMENTLYAQSINNHLIALSVKDGSVLWEHSGIPEVTQLLSGAAPTGLYDTLIVAYSSGELHALNTLTGQDIWSDTITPVARVDTVTGIPHIVATPVISGTHLYIMSHGGRMVVLDINTGSRLFQKEIGGTQPPCVQGDFTYVLSNHGEVVGLYKDNVIWVQKLDDKNAAGPVWFQSQLWVSTAAGTLVRLDPSDGHIIDTTPVDGACELPPMVVNDKLYVFTNDATLHEFVWEDAQVSATDTTAPKVSSQ